MALETWNLDPIHSFIHFSLRHFVVSRIHGRFTKWGGTIQLDQQQPASSNVSIRIDVNSIDTGDPRRDDHLKKPEFFDTEKYPEMTFQSTEIETAGPDRYRVTGGLTLRGITQPVTLDVEHGGQVKDMWGNLRGGFSIQGKIDRRDFGLSFAGTTENGTPILGNDIAILIDAEAVRVAAQSAS